MASSLSLSLPSLDGNTINLQTIQSRAKKKQVGKLFSAVAEPCIPTTVLFAFYFPCSFTGYIYFGNNLEKNKMSVTPSCSGGYEKPILLPKILFKEKKQVFEVFSSKLHLLGIVNRSYAICKVTIQVRTSTNVLIQSNFRN